MVTLTVFVVSTFAHTWFFKYRNGQRQCERWHCNQGSVGGSKSSCRSTFPSSGTKFEKNQNFLHKVWRKEIFPVLTQCLNKQDYSLAALATAVDDNFEASLVAKEVEARLQVFSFTEEVFKLPSSSFSRQDLQALQSSIKEQEIERARRKVPKECQTKRPKFSCTTNTRFFTSLSQKPR